MNATPKPRPPGTSANMKISIKRGVECFFDIDDSTIRVWASVWTGREVVELNNKVVSSKYSFRLSTPHVFEHNGHEYRVVFSIAKVMSGLIEVSLYRDGTLIDSDQGRHASIPVNPDSGEVNWRRYGWEILLYTLAGGLVGGVCGYLIATLVKGNGA